MLQAIKNKLEARKEKNKFRRQYSVISNIRDPRVREEVLAMIGN